MPVPAYSELMLPLLQYAGDEKEHHIRDAIKDIADYLQLSEGERNELLDSGKETKFGNRVRWANTYLKKAKLLKSVGRGIFMITTRGIEVLKSSPPHIDANFLKQFSEFSDFVNDNNQATNREVSQKQVDEQTPEDLINELFQDISLRLADELIEYVVGMPPSFFEKLVVDLLLAMGYGGALDSGTVTKQSGDDGIDGYVQEDKLGLSTIYIQAKKWGDRSVGAPAIRDFAGGLMSVGASKGVFITTSEFTSSAHETAHNLQRQNLKVVLIDGKQLAKLMIEHNIGVSAEQILVIKRIDTDYFDKT